MFTYGIPRNDLLDTPVISTQLHLCDATFAITRFMALRTALLPSKPKADILISPAMKKNVHPALLIAASRSSKSRLATNDQPLVHDSAPSATESGVEALVSIRTVPVLIVSVIRCVL